MSLFASDSSVDFRAQADEGQNGYLVFDASGIQFHADITLKRSYNFPASDIVGLDIDEDDEASQRITLTRLFFLKLYALAFPKRTVSVSSRVSVSLADGDRFAFLLPNVAADDVQARIAPFYPLHGETYDA